MSCFGTHLSTTEPCKQLNGGHSLINVILFCFSSAVLLLLLPLQDAQSYAEENGLLFVETSAKIDQNVSELFLAIGRLNAGPSSDH